MAQVLRVKVPSAVDSDKHIARDKGVLCEEESERSPRQSSDPTNRKVVRHKRMDKSAEHDEVPKLYGILGVDDTGGWNERSVPYLGRSRRRKRQLFTEQNLLREVSRPHSSK